MKNFLLLSVLTTLLSTLSFANTSIEIDPLAIESYVKEFNVSNAEAQKRLTIMVQNDEIVGKLNDEFGDSIASIFYDNG